MTSFVQQDVQFWYLMTYMGKLVMEYQVSTRDRRRLRELARAGELQVIETRVRRVPPFVEPALSWNVGDPIPTAGSCAYRLRQSWLNSPVSTEVAYVATPALYARVGLEVPRIDEHKLGHDAAVTRVAMIYLTSRPAEWPRFRNEQMLAHTRVGQKLPDAFIISPASRAGNLQVERAIEICSGYRRDRLQDFIEDCVRRDLPFEVWG